MESLYNVTFKDSNSGLNTRSEFYTTKEEKSCNIKVTNTSTGNTFEEVMNRCYNSTQKTRKGE